MAQEQMKTFNQIGEPAIAVTTRCVLMDQSEYERLSRIESRAQMKIEQLRGMAHTPGYQQYIRALEFVLGVESLSGDPNRVDTQ